MTVAGVLSGSGRTAEPARPDIEYALQRSARAVYLLIRGAVEPITPQSARCVVAWLADSRGIASDRDGPSAYPGPDGSRYEWFIRLKAAAGADGASKDDIYLAAASRINERHKASGTEFGHRFAAPDDFPLQDIVRAEVARSASYFRRQLLLLQRQLLVSVTLQRKVKHHTNHPSTVRDRTTIDELLAGLAAREDEATARQEELDDREQRLQAKEQWVSAENDRVTRQGSGGDGIDLEKLQEFLPRLDLDDESRDCLSYELPGPTRAAYLRFLAALNDRCDIASHPSCKKHEKIKVASGRTKHWWEIRLADYLAADYRLYYRHSPDNDRLQVCLRHKKDQQRFFAGL